MIFFKKFKNFEYKGFIFLNIAFKIERKLIRKTSKIYKNNIPLKKGFSLVGYFSKTYGESISGLDLSVILTKLCVPFDLVDFEKKSEPCYYNKITFTTSPFKKNNKYCEILALAWEFESGMIETRPYIFNNINKVVVFSSFVEKYVSKICPRNIRVIRIHYPINIEIKPTVEKDEIRKLYNLKSDDFVVFFNFSYSSSYYRKNPEGVLNVFVKALRQFPNCKLFLKESGLDKKNLKTKLLDIILKNNLINRVVFENSLLDRQSVWNIISSSDVYLSMHRGEGVGIGMLEAMTLGKTVIATNYGGSTDFVKKGIAFPINYKLVTPKKNQIDLAVYSKVTEWAEPDIDQASKVLKKLFFDRKLLKNTSIRARKFIEKEFSLAKFYKDINKIDCE